MKGQKQTKVQDYWIRLTHIVTEMEQLGIRRGKKFYKDASKEIIRLNELENKNKSKQSDLTEKLPKDSTGNSDNVFESIILGQPFDLIKIQMKNYKQKCRFVFRSRKEAEIFAKDRVVPNERK